MSERIRIALIKAAIAFPTDYLSFYPPGTEESDDIPAIRTAVCDGTIDFEKWAQFIARELGHE